MADRMFIVKQAYDNTSTALEDLLNDQTLLSKNYSPFKIHITAAAAVVVFKKDR